jgi:hypothetical protein
VLFPVVIKLRRSRLLLCGLLAVYGLAVAGVCLAEWPASLFWLAPGALVFLLLSAIHTGRNSLRQQPQTLQLHADGTLGLVFAGTPQPLLAAVRPGVLALPWICVFSWRLLEEPPVNGGAPRYGALTLLRDSADANALRRLRLWLQLRKDVDLA